MIDRGAQRQAVAHWLPPYRRTLEREQVDATWIAIVGLGLFDPGLGMQVDSGARVEPEPDQTLYVAVIGGGGVRWSLIARHDDGDALPALARLADQLAELAWATVLPPATSDIPKRYDYGPDPYARYRR